MDREELLHIIGKAKREKVLWLDLSHKAIDALPPEIGRLTQLTKLDLSYNFNLTTLPPEIGQLSQLAELNLSYISNLSTLPSEISQLSQLTKLDVTANKLRRLPLEIFGLVNLRTLLLGANGIDNLPSEIERLFNLEVLDLGTVQQTQEPYRRDGRENEIRHLPPELKTLSNLRTLVISHNSLEVFPVEIVSLKNLISLDLSDNLLTNIPTEICHLAHLKHLDLSVNKISILPPTISQLNELEALDLRENPISLPPEILSQFYSPSIILNYYSNLLSGKQSLNEAKILVLGQGNVGKTSLIKQIKKKPITNTLESDDAYSIFDPGEGKTEGIEIHHWWIDRDKNTIRLNVWGFGGQEIMHATHQFFLTKRSLYVLVLDSRVDDQENRIEYWLKIIQSFGGESPIIVVSNKIDQNPLELDKRGLQNKYPSIKSFVNTSCKDGRGISELRGLIAEEIGALDHIHDQLPNSWFNVKTQLEEMKRDFIVYNEYEQACDKEKIDDKTSRRTLIRLLHDLGTILNFQDDPRLQDTSIINPEWVTNGVYKIINSNELFQSKGVLEISQLQMILDPERYPANKHPFIMDLMKKFELCFEFEGERDKYLIPELLQKEEPDTGNWDDSLSFQYHYNVLPSSVVSRFIVRMHQYISKRTYWRNGVVVAHEGARALVKADREDRKIFISIVGERRREFLAVIRSHFDHIHKTIPRLEAKEKIAYKNIVIDYEHLLNLEDLDMSDFVPEGLREKVSVQSLLNGVEGKEARHNRVMMDRSGGVNIFADTVNIDGDVVGRDKRDS